VINATKFGCKAFALFLRNQRTWKLSPKDHDAKLASDFKKTCHKYGFQPKHILPHGSYLMNAGSPDPEVLRKTRESLVHEIKICEMFGLPYYNFHPGIIHLFLNSGLLVFSGSLINLGSSCGKISTGKCIEKIAETVNYVIKNSSFVTLGIKQIRFLFCKSKFFLFISSFGNHGRSG